MHAQHQENAINPETLYVTIEEASLLECTEVKIPEAIIDLLTVQ